MWAASVATAVAMTLAGTVASADAATISGTVTRAATGAPAASAVTLIRNSPGSPGGFAHVAGVWTTTGDPSFSFAGLRAGTYYVRAEPQSSAVVGEWYDDTHATDRTPIELVSDETDVAGVHIALDPPASVTGRVTDLSNAGLGAVRVAWYHQDVTGGWVEGGECCEYSLSDGAYELTGLPAGPIRISYEPEEPGHASAWTGDTPGAGAPDEAVAGSFALGTSEHRTGVDMALIATVPIPGHVADGSGRPVEGVRIGYWRLYKGEYAEVRRERAYADEDGDFTLWLPRLPAPAGSYWFKIAFEPDPETGLAAEFWNDRPDLASADVYEVPVAPPYQTLAAVLGAGAPGTGSPDPIPEPTVTVAPPPLAPPPPSAPAVITAARKPRIVGTARVGRRVEAASGPWEPAGVSLRHQWLIDDKPVKGATGRRLRLRKSWLGKRVSVRVTATKAGYVALTRTSNRIRVRRPARVAS